MKRSRFFFVYCQLLVAAMVLFSSVGFAKIPEPSAVYYGNVSIGAISVTAQNTAVQVSLRIGDKVVSTYQMGSNTELGDQYILVIPMDAVGEREPNSGRQGDVATILVMGNEAATFSIEGKGRFVQKNLSVTAEDSDNDGMTDLWENEHGLDPFNASDASADPDGDGLTNLQEFGLQTDPNSADTDGDGMNDGFEITYGFDPTDNSDAALDEDEDGYTNLEEAQNGTNPTLPDEVQPFRVVIAKSITGHDGNVAALVYNDEKLISASQHEAVIKTWNVSDGLLDSSTDTGTVNGINVLAVSGNLLFAGTGDSTVLKYDNSGSYPELAETFSQAQGSILAFTIFNDQLIAGSADGSVNIWDINTNAYESWMAQAGVFISGVSAVEGRFYTIGSFPSKSIKIWNTDKDNTLTITSSDSCCDLTNLHLNGERIFISRFDGPNTVKSLSIGGGEVQDYAGQIENTASLATTNHKLFSGDGTGIVNVWGMTSGELLMSFKAHDQPINSLIATDTQLMTGDASGKIKIWNLHEDVAGDTDFDGMLDSWELSNGLDPTTASDKGGDRDADGLTNLEEYINQTNPQSSDTDNDLMPDKWELDNGLDPTSALDAYADADGDGLTNLQEYQAKTNPNNIDSDGDLMADQWEIDYGLNPNDPADASADPDGDSLTNLQEFQGGTDPLVV